MTTNKLVRTMITQAVGAEASHHTTALNLCTLLSTQLKNKMHIYAIKQKLQSASILVTSLSYQNGQRCPSDRWETAGSR